MGINQQAQFIGTQLVGHKEEVNDMSDVVQALQPHKRGDYLWHAVGGP